MSEIIQLYKDDQKAYPKTLASQVYLDDGETKILDKFDEVNEQLETKVKQTSNMFNYRKLYKGILCDFLDLNPGGSDLITSSQLKAQLEQMKSNSIMSVIFQPWITWNNETNKCEVFKGNKEKIETLLKEIELYGITIKCFKLHFYYIDLEKITLDGKINLFKESYKILVSELLEICKKFNIEYSIVFNESELLYKTNSDYVNFVNETIQISKNKGFKTGISTMGAKESLFMENTIKNNVDLFFVNCYPKLSFKGGETTLNDCVQGWNNSFEAKCIKELAKTKKIIMSETGCNDYWECLYNPGNWEIKDYYTFSNGKAPALMLNGVLESELKNIVSEIWWCYNQSILNDECKKVIQRYCEEV